MDLIRWTPWGSPEVARIREDLARIFDNPLRLLEREHGIGAGYPVVEVSEGADKVVVRAEIPGVNPKDVDLRITRDSVILKGELHEEREVHRGGFYHTERRYGQFYRTVPLPVPVKPDGAEARHKNGVLEIKVPKEQEGPHFGRKVPIVEDDAH